MEPSIYYQNVVIVSAAIPDYGINQFEDCHVTAFLAMTIRSEVPYQSTGMPVY